mgnify:CR=1 FL=1
MKRTLNLIIKTVWNTCRMLPVNWLLYSLSLVTFNVLWVLLPENVSIAIINRDAEILFLSGIIGLTAAMALFFNTYLSNNAWMQINKVRYAILIITARNIVCRINYSRYSVGNSDTSAAHSNRFNIIVIVTKIDGFGFLYV